MSKKKTLKGWENTDVDIDQYLFPMDQVDEELYLHFGEVVAPQYSYGSFMQVGEASHKIHGVYYYMTFARYNNKYYYLGKLPEFKQ